MKKKKRYQGFTLLEMLVVLLVISVLILLFVPNLSAQRKKIDAEGDASLTQVVKTQAELYRLDQGKTPGYQDLVDSDYLTADQAKKAQDKNITIE